MVMENFPLAHEAYDRFFQLQHSIQYTADNDVSGAIADELRSILQKLWAYRNDRQEYWMRCYGLEWNDAMNQACLDVFHRLTVLF